MAKNTPSERLCAFLPNAVRYNKLACFSACKNVQERKLKLLKRFPFVIYLSNFHKNDFSVKTVLTSDFAAVILQPFRHRRLIYIAGSEESSRIKT